MIYLQCGASGLQARITARAAHMLGLAPGMPVWAQLKSVALAD
jgi:molybdate transport system ATP-binding protein